MLINVNKDSSSRIARIDGDRRLYIFQPIQYLLLHEVHVVNLFGAGAMPPCSLEEDCRCLAVGEEMMCLAGRVPHHSKSIM